MISGRIPDKATANRLELRAPAHRSTSGDSSGDFDFDVFEPLGELVHHHAVPTLAFAAKEFFPQRFAMLPQPVELVGGVGCGEPPHSDPRGKINSCGDQQHEQNCATFDHNCGFTIVTIVRFAHPNQAERLDTISFAPAIIQADGPARLEANVSCLPPPG